jgi:hypothetical protein
MEISGKLIHVLPLQTGSGKNGQWKKQEIVIETEGQYPKKVCIAIWGDKIQESSLQIGNKLNVSFDVESREYNGKWYTDVKAWKVEVVGKSQPPASSGINEYNEIPPENFGPANESDDLPF